MTIESKFEIHQRIYWMEHNRVASAVIKYIKFPLVQWIKGYPLIVEECLYFVSKNVKSSVINWNGGGLKESQIFISKRELLKSL